MTDHEAPSGKPFIVILISLHSSFILHAASRDNTSATVSKIFTFGRLTLLRFEVVISMRSRAVWYKFTDIVEERDAFMIKVKLLP